MEELKPITKNKVVDRRDGLIFILLSMNYIAIMDDTLCMWEVLKNHQFCCNVHGGRPYAVTNISKERSKSGKREHVYLHHFVCPKIKGMTVDHINGNSLDNRVVNLRSVSYRINVLNSKPKSTNTTGIVGLARQPFRNRWLVKWSDEHHKVMYKYFSDSRFGGMERAKELAIDCLTHIHSTLSGYIEAKSL